MLDVTAKLLKTDLVIVTRLFTECLMGFRQSELGYDTVPGILQLVRSDFMTCCADSVNNYLKACLNLSAVSDWRL